MSWLERAYAALLRLYPAAFRAEYGGPMRLHFRDQLRDARQAGGAAVNVFVLRALWDMLRTARAERRGEPSASPDERVGWGQVAPALISGALVLFAAFTTLWPGLPYPLRMLAYVIGLLVIPLGGWLLDGRLRAWMLPVVGFLVATAFYMGIAYLSSLAEQAGLPGTAQPWPILVASGAAGLVVLWAVARLARTHPRRAALALLPLGVVLAAPAIGTVDRSPGFVLGLIAASGTWLYVAVVALGLPLARRLGDRAALWVVGAMVWMQLFFVEPVQVAGGRDAVNLYQKLVVAACLLLAPLIVLRARRAWVRAAGVLLPVAAVSAVALGLVAARWGADVVLRRADGAVQFVGWLAFALVLYGGVCAEDDTAAQPLPDCV